MCAVKKTHTASEVLTAHLTADPLLLKKLHDPNADINELRKIYGITAEDYLDFAQFNHAKLAVLIQSDKTYAGFAEPPDIIPMSVMQEQAALTQEDHAEIQMMFSEMAGRGPKMATSASVGAKSAGTGDEESRGGAKVSIQEDLANAHADAEEANTFADLLDNHIFEIQLQNDLSKKSSELMNELERVKAMVKNGQVDPVFLLIAITKVVSERNGLLFTQFGKRLMNLNETSDKIINELSSGSITPASMQMSQQKLKEVTQGSQFILGDMQKLTQNIESTLSFAKQAIDDIFKTRLQLINAPFRSM